MWSHAKIKGKTFQGNYEYAKSGNRVLYLEHINAKWKKDKSYKFSSWQAAKAAGWVHA